MRLEKIGKIHEQKIDETTDFELGVLYGEASVLSRSVEVNINLFTKVYDDIASFNKEEIKIGLYAESISEEEIALKLYGESFMGKLKKGIEKIWKIITIMMEKARKATVESYKKFSKFFNKKFKIKNVKKGEEMLKFCINYEELFNLIKNADLEIGILDNLSEDLRNVYFGNSKKINKIILGGFEEHTIGEYLKTNEANDTLKTANRIISTYKDAPGIGPEENIKNMMSRKYKRKTTEEEIDRILSFGKKELKTKSCHEIFRNIADYRKKIGEAERRSEDFYSEMFALNREICDSMKKALSDKTNDESSKKILDLSNFYGKIAEMMYVSTTIIPNGFGSLTRGFYKLGEEVSNIVNN